MENLSPLDITALIWFIIAKTCFSLAARYSLLANKGLISAMKKERVQWMHTMARRETRMVDMQIMTNLSHGNAFFASTAVIIMGGLATLLGSSNNNIVAVIDQIPFFAPTTPWVWNAKILLVICLFIIAFFKFAWAFRLSHYTSILLGATPIYDGKNLPECIAQADRTASLASLAGYHANAGLHAYYFGIAALSWFIHPALFILTTTLVLFVLYRREYISRAVLTLTNTP